jgi:undecaprenyl-diphosphatase
LIGTALMLTAGEFVSKKLNNQVYGIDAMKIPQGFTIGLIQTLAMFPGISRSGVTMIAGMVLGLSRESAARFSLLLATPAIAGAGVLVAFDAFDSSENVDLRAGAIGAIISAITAYFVIAGLLKLLRNGSFRPFIIYCAVAGVAVVIARATGA